MIFQKYKMFNKEKELGREFCNSLNKFNSYLLSLRYNNKTLA